MHPVAVHWAKKSNCSAEEWYSASFRLSAYNDSCTALTHNWESLLLNTYKQHIAHFMMWEQEKYWAVLWLIQKHVGIRRNNLSTASAWQRISAVCKKSNHLWIQSVCISLGQEKSQQSKPGFGENLAPNSQTIIWTIHLDKKNRPSSYVLGTRPRGLDPTGQNSPTDSQTPISVVSEGRHEGEYRDTTPLLQYLWTINDSAKMSSEISCRWLAKRGN